MWQAYGRHYMGGIPRTSKEIVCSEGPKEVS